MREYNVINTVVAAMTLGVRFVFLILSLFKQLQMIDSQVINMQMTITLQFNGAIV